MKEENNIDKLFSESLGNYSPTPPPEVWKKIGAGLTPPASVAPATSISGTFLIGLATLLITGISVLWYFSGTKEHSAKKEVNPQKEIPETVNRSSVKINATKDENSELTTTIPQAEIEKTTLLKEPVNHSSNQNNTTLTSVINEPALNKTSAPEIIAKVQAYEDIPLATTEQSSEALKDLRNDFISWLIMQPARFTVISGISGYDKTPRTSEKPILPKRSRKPVLAGIYAEWDQIDYDKNFKKQNRSLGLSLSTFKGPWIFETGVAYSLSDDNGRFMINYNSFDSIGYYNKVVSFSVDQQNPGTIHFNTEIQGVYDSISHATETLTRSRYTYLQIPLIAGYQLYSNRLVTISVKAGPVFSVLLASDEPSAAFNREGAILQSIENLSPVRISTNWQIAAALGAGFHLSRSLTFMLEPTYRSYLRPVYKNNRNSPYSIGLKAGFYYRF